MSCVAGLFRSRLVPLASMIALALGVAGCSGESTRFNENPFASRTDTTGSVAPMQSAPVVRIESQPLPPAGYVQSQAAPAASHVATAGANRVATPYAPAAAPVAPRPPAVASRPLTAPEVTGSVKPAAR